MNKPSYYYYKERRKERPFNAIVLAVSIALATLLAGIIVLLAGCRKPVYAKPITYTNEQIANAIYKAENSKAHPYGILAHYKHTTPRQACLNTIKSAQKRFAKQTKEKDFIHFLSLTYCPIGASNDPRGLNKNWVRNVKYFLT